MSDERLGAERTLTWLGSFCQNGRAERPNLARFSLRAASFGQMPARAPRPPMIYSGARRVPAIRVRRCIDHHSSMNDRQPWPGGSPLWLRSAKTSRRRAHGGRLRHGHQAIPDAAQAIPDAAQAEPARARQGGAACGRDRRRGWQICAATGRAARNDQGGATPPQAQRGRAPCARRPSRSDPGG
jgi:hypothetical protein